MGEVMNLSMLGESHSYTEMNKVEVVQYKYEEGEFMKLVKMAFTMFTANELEKVTFVTKDTTVKAPRCALLMFSPMLRRTMSEVPSQEEVVISMPDCSSRSIMHLINLLNDGDTLFQGDEVSTVDVLVAANCLGIDLNSFEYVMSKERVGQAENRFETVVGDNVQNEQTKSVTESNTPPPMKGREPRKNKSRNNVSKESKKTKNTSKKNSEVPKNSSEKVTENSTNVAAINQKVTNCEQKDYVQSRKTLINNLIDYSGDDIYNEDYNDEDFDEFDMEDEEQFNKNLEDTDPKIDTSVVGEVNNELESLLDKSVLGDESSLNEIQSPSLAPNVGTVKTTEAEAKPNSKSKSMGLWAMSTNRQQFPNLPSLQREKQPAVARHPSLPVQRPVLHNPSSFTRAPSYSVGNQIAQPRSALPNSSVQPDRVNRFVHPAATKPSSSSEGSGRSQPLSSPVHNYKSLSQPNAQNQYVVGQQSKQVTNQYNSATLSTPNSRNTSASREEQASAQKNNLNSPSLTKSEPQSSVANGSPPQPGLPCQLCPKPSPTLSKLWQHYASRHFMAELRSSHAPSTDLESKTCSLCGNQFKNVANLLMHVGVVHYKVNEIMKAKGLEPLSMPKPQKRRPEGE
jgi:hypothetical protein